MIKINARKRLRRLCHDCGKKYSPSGKFTKFCDKCIIKRKKIGTIARMKKKQNICPLCRGRNQYE